MKTSAFIFAGILAVASLASAIPNPAAVFCGVKCGYRYEIRTDPEGNQYGVCVFPDGSECEEWAFYRKCNAPQTCGDCNCPWPCPKRIIFVDDDANGLNDGSSWQNAYKFLQDALMMSREGDELRVAQGIYKPDDFALSDRPNLGRAETFQLINGVTLKGGYAGFGQPDPNARDINRYETILSGDLSDNDEPFRGPAYVWDDPTRAENSYHVILASRTDLTAILDGFITIGGYANGSWGTEQSIGGGVYNDSGSPTLINCIFDSHFANCTGAGIYNHKSAPTLTNCKFTWNFSRNGGAMYNINSSPILMNCMFGSNMSPDGGGGMYNYNLSSPVLTNCIFADNRTWSDGGGMCNAGSSPILTNCTFSDNYASDGDGGGIYNDHSSTTLIGCLFSYNYAFWGGGAIGNRNDSGPNLMQCTFVANGAWWGGGISNCSESNVTLKQCIFTKNYADTYGGALRNSSGGTLMSTNCTFTENSAPDGNGVACNSDYPVYPSNVEITNCILWDGGNEIWSNDGSVITITYSDVHSGWLGEGNINVDPCFVSFAYQTWSEDKDGYVWISGDYLLKSQAGRWDENSASWVKDDVTSPCIDAGDPTSPIGLEQFPNGGIINMGAYGGTAEASKSYFGEPVCETIVAGDINGDCKVDFKDFAIMAFHWLEEH